MYLLRVILCLQDEIAAFSRRLSTYEHENAEMNSRIHLLRQQINDLNTRKKRRNALLMLKKSPLHPFLLHTSSSANKREAPSYGPADMQTHGEDTKLTAQQKGMQQLQRKPNRLSLSDEADLT